MTSEELESIVAAAGLDTSLMRMGAASCIASEGCAGVTLDDLQKIVAAALASPQPPIPAGFWLARMEPFGFRDLKGKGATDMWLAGEPIEKIQLLCGHADKATTEIYIKARWRQTAASNSTKLA